MSQPKTTRKTPVLYAVTAWMLINTALMVLLVVNGDYMDLNNWIEIALWITAIPAVLSAKKWGFAFAIFVLAYTLSTSVGILLYYQVWINALRFINVPIAIYLFKQLFENKAS